MKVCKVDDCEKIVKSRELCDMHYMRLRRNGSLLNPFRHRDKVCKIENCQEKNFGKDYCKSHYTRFARNRDEIVQLRPQCQAPGCDSKSRTKQYCKRHYERLRTTGSLELKQLEPSFKCKIDHCGRQTRSKLYGLCKMHYERQRMNGCATIVKPNSIPKYETLMQRFEHHIEIVTESGCWIWTGRTDKHGYGSMSELGKNRGKVIRAHRFAYQQFVGEIPDGLFVCHRCDCKSCCNPKHLFVGTHQDNMDDLVEKRFLLQKHKQDYILRMEAN